VLVEVDLLVDLPSSINITLPNGVSKPQVVLYESLPWFCKRCKTPGHSNFACNKSSSHKRKKHPPTALAPSGFSNSSADTKAVAKQLIKEEPQGEPKVDPMATEAAVAVDERADCSVRKRENWLLSLDPLMLLLTLLRLFTSLKIALTLLPHYLQGGNT
jgi:hypothetical protein